MSGNGNTYYFHGNHQGSIMALSTDSQRVSQYEYDPYGKTQLTGETSDRFRYTAREQDADDLYYYRARYYDPTTYRFLSEDPIGLAGGLNVYAYVGGDPMNWIDPWGLKYAEIYGGYGGIAGGAIVAGGSVVVDAATGGLNILATPAEITAGVALGGAIGYSFGYLVDLATGNISYFAKSSKGSAKERATDIPSWVNDYSPRGPNEKCSDYAVRVLAEKYGCNDKRAQKRGPGSEYSKIKKHCERG